MEGVMEGREGEEMKGMKEQEIRGEGRKREKTAEKTRF